MKTRVLMWGNSLAIRIPKAFAEQVNFERNTEVELDVIDGVLSVTPVKSRRYTLKELVSGITDENRHEEISTGASVGNERW